MTDTTPGPRQATLTRNGAIRALIAAVSGQIRDYLETRKAGRPHAFYRNHKQETLERARHDVNRFWNGQM